MNDSKSAQAGTRRTAHQAPPAEATSPWEWPLAALGLILIVGAIGYMGYFAVATRSEPPTIAIARESVEPNGDGYLVIVTVTNRGDSTAASLTIAGTLKQGGEIVESSEATIDYLPRHSERRAGLYFTRDPTRFRLEIRPKGYAEP